MVTDRKLPHINTALPPDAHPAVLSGELPRLVDASSRAYEVWGAAVEAAEKLDAQAASLRPKLVPGQRKMSEVQRLKYDQQVAVWRGEMDKHKKELADVMRPKFERAFVALDNAVEQTKAHLAEKRESLRAALVPHNPVQPIHTEIRARLGKKPNLATLKAAVETGDEHVLSVVLGTTPFLLGVEEKDQKVMFVSAAKTFQPEMDAEIRKAEADLTRAENMRASFAKHTAEFVSRWRTPALDVIEEVKNV
ncbi:MAG: hypothetical protein AAGI27_00660 [Pseudomonadota bacterium]